MYIFSDEVLRGDLFLGVFLSFCMKNFQFGEVR